ncbi:MAG: hypothetical protein JWO38_4704, partial [Gemmataceae bacterium]|nr:hypothetical protein [Gemmataceae bacterium]
MVRIIPAAIVTLLAALTLSAGHPAPVDPIGRKPAAAQLVGLDGKAAGLADLRGKRATVLVFISAECPVSNSYLAGLAELARE